MVAVNDAPSGTDNTVTINEDSRYVFSWSDFGYSDPDNSSNPAIRFISVPTEGTLYLDTDGPGGSLGTALTAGYAFGQAGVQSNWLVYVPAADSAASVTFSFRAIESGGAEAAASNTFTIQINSVNDAPVLTAPQAVLANGTEDVAYTVTTAQLLTGFTDADNDTLSVASVSSLNGTVTSNPNGTYTITRPANANGQVTLSYNVVDGNGGVTAATLNYIVNAVNDAPTALALLANTVAENSANGTVVGTLQPTDPDAGDTFTYVLLNNAGGRFAVNSVTGVITVANGTLLDFETAQQYSIEAQVTDAAGQQFRQVLTISLTNIAEAKTYNGTATVNDWTAPSSDNWTVTPRAAMTRSPRWTATIL